MFSNVINVLHKFIVQFIGEGIFESKVELTFEISFQGLKENGVTCLIWFGFLETMVIWNFRKLLSQNQECNPKVLWLFHFNVGSIESSRPCNMEEGVSSSKYRPWWIQGGLVDVSCPNFGSNYTRCFIALDCVVNVKGRWTWMALS
jgi:hypothetical protein